MKASILINNYNYGRYLRECIDSACAQTYADVEVVVVDDGSTDGSIDIINSYGSRITSVLKTNGGQASCFNAGFARASGDVIFFLDADDVFHPRKVAAVIDIYRSLKVQWCFDVVDQTQIPAIAGAAPTVVQCDFRASTAKGGFPNLPAPTSGLSFARELLAKMLPMPTSRGIALSDNYLKFVGVALGVGALLGQPYTYQRIHGSNRYTQSEDNKLRQTEIMLATGESIARNFPALSGIATKLVAGAIADTVVRNGIANAIWLRPWQTSLFTLGQKLHITARAGARAIATRLKRATMFGAA